MNTIKLTAMAFGLAAANVFAQEASTAQTANQPAVEPTKATDVAVEKKGPEFKVSGKAEFDAYAHASTAQDQRIYHSYASTIDVDFNVKFNENWSAFAEIEADGNSEDPFVTYKKAYIQYNRGDNFTLRVGDLTFSEGAFSFYNYDDAGIYAAGMREHDIRGLDMQLYGFQFGLGFGRGSNDFSCSKNISCYGEANKSYDIHLAYQFDIAGQSFRPFFHYKSWQTKDENELHAGLHTDLLLGPFDIHAVYGLHADRMKKSYPNATHALLAEPTLNLGRVLIKTGIFFAFFDDDMDKATIHESGDAYEIPEYKFAYGEIDFKATDIFTAGFVGEWHTNTIDNTKELGSVNFGPRLYFSPVENLNMKGFVKVVVPVGDDWKKDEHDKWVSTTDYGKDASFYFGLETIFNF
ncbi:hypothetical protein [Fibrobacter sp. UWB13]|uniref:hypothetical protein n=1 Tax=Fibrobacter sp. UWB13 TaxID=1896204 RepID=UPI000A0D3BB7|nr:hypothetical protein [Fibrobacter sp. UWB13]SMG38299.1 hypothetical protein SAMN05720489_2641 [Fibrobacter sp. UWB13]